MLPILSPTWEAPSPEKPALRWKSITDFPKPTLHLEDSGRKFGTDEESTKRHGPVFMSGGLTYDGHISKPGITELKVGSSENWYSRVR